VLMCRLPGGQQQGSTFDALEGSVPPGSPQGRRVRIAHCVLLRQAAPRKSADRIGQAVWAVQLQLFTDAAACGCRRSIPGRNGGPTARVILHSRPPAGCQRLRTALLVAVTAAAARAPGQTCRQGTLGGRLLSTSLLRTAS
jgi:hypothetical protein